MKKISILFIVCFICLLSCDDLFLPSWEIEVIAHEPVGGIIRRSESCTITWEILKKSKNGFIPAGEDKKVNIYLIKENQEEVIIATDIENSGSYPWTPDNIKTGAGYRFKISTVDDTVKRWKSNKSGPFHIDGNPWQSLGFAGSNTNCMIAGIAMGPDNNEPVIAYRYTAPKSNYPLVKYFLHATKWNGETWVDLGNVAEKLVGNYALCLDNAENPSIVYAGGVNQGTFFGTYNSPGWNSDTILQQGTLEGSHMGSTATNSRDIPEDTIIMYTAALSAAITPGGKPVISYLNADVRYDPDDPGKFTIIVTLILKKRTSNGWEYWGSNGDSVYRTVWKGFKIDLIENAPVDIPYYTSLVLDSTGIPYVAFQDHESIDDNNSGKWIRVYTFQEDAWVPLGRKHINEENADFPSLAIGSDNYPVLLYNRDRDKKLIVKKYNGTGWKDLAYPCEGGIEEIKIDLLDGNIADGFAALTIAKGNNPVVASSEGIKMFDGNSWINLGYPNFPSGGMGKNSWWIAGNEKSIAVAFPDKDNDYKVSVRRLDL